MKYVTQVKYVNPDKALFGLLHDSLEHDISHVRTRRHLECQTVARMLVDKRQRFRRLRAAFGLAQYPDDLLVAMPCFPHPVPSSFGGYSHYSLARNSGGRSKVTSPVSSDQLRCESFRL